MVGGVLSIVAFPTRPSIKRSPLDLYFLSSSIIRFNLVGISLPQGIYSSHTIHVSKANLAHNVHFIAVINIHDISKLKNDPIAHDITCQDMPTDFPLDIPKFQGKHVKYPINHVVNFIYGSLLTSSLTTQFH